MEHLHINVSKIKVITKNKGHSWRSSVSIDISWNNIHPYSRQMQLWPMMRSTLCPSPTSTPPRWRWTRCSATATNPGGLEGALWVSSKRWWDTFGLLLFDWSVIYIVTYYLRGERDNEIRVRTVLLSGNLDIYPANQSYPRTKQSKTW